MEIKNKCDIIEEFMRDHVFGEQTDEEIDQFVKFNDLGIPLAQAVSYDLAVLTKNGEFLVDETWVALCELFDVDPNSDYDDLDEFFESD